MLYNRCVVYLKLHLRCTNFVYLKEGACILHEPSIKVSSFFFASSFKLKQRTSTLHAYERTVVQQSAITNTILTYVVKSKQCLLRIVILGLIITHIEPRTSTLCTKLLSYSSGLVQIKSDLLTNLSIATD